MLVTTIFFLNHTGRKKSFDANDGNKSDISVEKYFRCICLNSVGTALSVGRIFSTPPPRTEQTRRIVYCSKLLARLKHSLYLSNSRQSFLYISPHINYEKAETQSSKIKTTKL
jgi:hypothetical protein